MSQTAMAEEPSPRKDHVAQDGPTPGRIYRWSGENKDIPQYGQGPLLGVYELREDGVYWEPTGVDPGPQPSAHNHSDPSTQTSGGQYTHSHLGGEESHSHEVGDGWLGAWRKSA